MEVIFFGVSSCIFDRRDMMPSIVDKLRVGKHDKRVKLSKNDKDEIRYRYIKIGGVSQRELAREYKVSRRTIVFAIYPERREGNYKQRVARGGSKQYYDKDKRREEMQRHRKHKEGLLKEGKI